MTQDPRLFRLHQEQRKADEQGESALSALASMVAVLLAAFIIYAVHNGEAGISVRAILTAMAVLSIFWTYRFVQSVRRAHRVLRQLQEVIRDSHGPR